MPTLKISPPTLEGGAQFEEVLSVRIARWNLQGLVGTDHRS